MLPTRKDILRAMHDYMINYPDANPYGEMVDAMLYEFDLSEYDPDATPVAPTDAVRQMIYNLAMYAVQTHTSKYDRSDLNG